MSGAPRDVRHDEPRLRLKIATRKAIKAVHGTEMAAEITGSRQQRMSDCQLPNTPDFLRLDEAHALDESSRGSADFPAITRAMARNHGFALLPLIDDAGALGEGEWHQAIAAVSREANEAVARVCSALPEGVTPEEIHEGQIIEEIDDAIAALARLRALAVATVRSGNVRQIRSA
jgi:hypothetical protein